MTDNKFAGANVFLLDFPLMVRERVEARLLAEGSKSVDFISIRRPIRDYHARIAASEQAAILAHDTYALPYDLLSYVQENNIPLLVAKSTDGVLSIEEKVDILGAMATHPNALQPVEPKSSEEDKGVDHLLFAPKADNIGNESGTPVFDLQTVGRPADKVSVDDITVILCVRAHHDNPWVMDRLAALPEMYCPAPRFVIVDFGSPVEFSEQIEDICARAAFKYVYVDDKDVFSLACARNAGYQHAETDLLFFTDIDFAFEADFFETLSNRASRIGIKSCIDIILMCSAVHMSEMATANYVRKKSREERSAFLAQLGNDCVYDKFGNLTEFVAPYSNICLVHRNFFDLSGGYNEDFRGHGSEDFEMVSRWGFYSMHFPIPADLLKDTGGPLRSTFFEHKKYEGFRVLSGLTGLPGELQGLKAFHMYHPTKNNDSWRQNNDWKRDKLRAVFEEYETKPYNLLRMDFLPRPKRAICISSHRDQWGYFAPLRLAGYELIPVLDGSVQEIEMAANLIVAGEVDTFAIFNPYMQSHMKYLALYYLAKKYCKTIVIERGALPSTIYYASDVAYSAEEYGDAAFAQYVPTTEEKTQALIYMAELRKGKTALEQGTSYVFTSRKYCALKAMDRPIIFIPLQLDEDMAVTMFKRDAQFYPEFYESINAIAAANPEMIFLIKPHPLSKGNTPLRAPNIILADRTDNIHCLIDLASTVIVYNSGVSLLAMAHLKPVHCIGNAYFNKGGAGRFADSLEDAIADFKANPIWSPDEDAVATLYAWLLIKRYSTFEATDSVQDFANRKAHGYKNIVVTSLTLDEQTYNLGRMRGNHDGFWKSYGIGHLSIEKV